MGDEENIDLSFVKAHMDLLSYHPFKSQLSDVYAAKEAYFNALNGSLKRF